MAAKKPHERSAEKILEFFEEAGAMAMQINQEYQQGELPFKGLQVEYLNIDMIRPDPVQPRRILPEDLHIHLHNQQMSPRQAIREFVERIKAYARSKGRPFSNPFELVTTPENENAEAPSDLAPEEKTLRDLLHLAVTLHQDGQVNPLTVIQIQQGIVARADVVQGVKPFQEVETAAPDAPEPAQPPVSGHPQQPQANEAPPLGVVRPDEVQQPQPTPQPAKNLDDPRGEKAALFQSVGLKPQHYTPFITYSLSDIQAAIQSARERQARHVGHYALAILKKQPAPPHQTIDYELLMNRWQEYEAPKAAPPPDENYNIWMAFGKTALATMGDKHLWPKIQHAYHSFIVETDELLLRRDKLPDHDGFVRQFVDRVQMIPWKRQETDPSKRFCVKVKLI